MPFSIWVCPDISIRFSLSAKNTQLTQQASMENKFISIGKKDTNHFTFGMVFES